MDQTVGNILKAHGVQPAPDRQRTGLWNTFLKPHWDVLGAIDFTTIEIWAKGHLITYYLLRVMEFKTRRVHFAGRTPHPEEAWMKVIASNVTGLWEAGISVGEAVTRESRCRTSDKITLFVVRLIGTCRSCLSCQSRPVDRCRNGRA